MQTALSKLNEEERKEYWACLALRYAQSIGTTSVSRLMKHFGSAFVAVQSLEDWEQVGLGAKSKYIEDDQWRKMATVEWENARDLDATIILWTSKTYPENLKHIEQAPSMLYALGDIELLKKPSIGVVGARNCTKTGTQIAEYLGTALSLCGFSVISGMARGIDRAGHIGGLKHSASSIGVLGCGIDVAYPNINSDLYLEMRKKGLLLSEFAPTTLPDPRHFPARNRIISGLSYGVVVVEASRRSGSTITAYTANEQGKNVYAVPGALGAEMSFGCQQLIRNGAKAIFNVEDILEDVIPLLAMDNKEINSVLKSHKLSSEDLFLHNSVLNLNKEEKKNASKKFTHTQFEDNTNTQFKSESPQIKEKKVSNTKGTPLLDDFTKLFQAESKDTKEENVKKTTKKVKKEVKETIEEKIHKEIDITDYEAWYSKESLEYQVISLLAEKKMHFDTLCQALCVSPQDLSICLIKLELQDHIARYEGSWYGRYEY